jgi:1,4-alpha-glucan branching enzyme
MATDDELELIRRDPSLRSHERQIRDRRRGFEEYIHYIEPTGGLLGSISLGHRYFGFNRGEQEGVRGVWYREWAPAASYVALTGDFNGWDRGANPLRRDEHGVWSVFLPDGEYAGRLVHQTLVKTHIVGASGHGQDRIPAYARRVIQDPVNLDFTAQFWMPENPYKRIHPTPEPKSGLRIYEAHVGMASEEGKIASFNEFTAFNIPRIAGLGYNAIQLMAVQEHPYYGSFGYHVSSFYAVSSRFGTPDDMLRLIDEAHAHGLLVIMDLVHSHAVRNVNEGLNQLDGTQYQYFHDGARGIHPAWDSMLFDYRTYEVQRYLLSNVRYWLEDFGFDGFRFDGVTSMLYHDHGLGHEGFNYGDYFGANVDGDSSLYLQLANALAHQVAPKAVTIAEDVSGMPGIARPIEEGGFGFDYRLAMGLADYWVRQAKIADEHWSPTDIYWAMLNRRRDEKHVAYVESHDQSLVGDKTLAFRYMDASMYWHMARDRRNYLVDRGLALHKLTRLITFFLGGEAYLNFMGNEFGHPEWVDFPRDGNGWSFHYARRQWSLADNDALLYSDLQRFDAAMQHMGAETGLLEDEHIELMAVHEDGKWMVCRRGELVLAVNLHPSQSHSDLPIPMPWPGGCRIILNTDAPEFGGFGLSNGVDGKYPEDTPPGGSPTVRIYLPSRTAQVLGPA